MSEHSFTVVAFQSLQKFYKCSQNDKLGALNRTYRLLA